MRVSLFTLLACVVAFVVAPSGASAQPPGLEVANTMYFEGRSAGPPATSGVIAPESLAELARLARMRRRAFAGLSLAGGAMLVAGSAFGSYSRIEGRRPPTAFQLGVGMGFGMPALAIGLYQAIARTEIEELAEGGAISAERLAAAIEAAQRQRRRIGALQIGIALAGAGLIVGGLLSDDERVNDLAGFGGALLAVGGLGATFSFVPPMWERRGLRLMAPAVMVRRGGGGASVGFVF